MGKPLMIQPKDEERIEQLKEELKAKTKIEIVRAGLDLLEKKTAHLKRIEQWKKAAKWAAAESAQVNKEFRKFSRLKKI